MKKIQKPPECVYGPTDENTIFLVKKFNRDYLHWDELRYRTDEESIEKIWGAMKYLRDNTCQSFALCGSEYHFVVTPEIQRMLYEIDRCSLNDFGKRISDSSAMEEAIFSSQIEGAAVTRKDAKKMLREKRHPRTVGERMIMNNYSAMEFLKTATDEKMTLDIILKMHKIITSGTLKDKDCEGKIRETDDVVVGDPLDEIAVFHEPPEHGKIVSMLKELCDYANFDGEVFVHPMIKASILHFMIGYIHPFVDGNGRLARTLFYWYSLRNGYGIMEYSSLSRIIKNSRTKYGLAFQYAETDDNDLTYFIKFNLECVLKSLDELKNYVERKKSKETVIAEIVKNNPELVYEEAEILIDFCDEKFSLSELSSKYGVSYYTVRNRVKDLCEKNYLKKIGKAKKNVEYAVSKKLRR